MRPGWWHFIIRLCLTPEYLAHHNRQFVFNNVNFGKTINTNRGSPSKLSTTCSYRTCDGHNESCRSGLFRWQQSCLPRVVFPSLWHHPAEAGAEVTVRTSPCHPAEKRARHLFLINSKTKSAQGMSGSKPPCSCHEVSLTSLKCS